MAYTTFSSGELGASAILSTRPAINGTNIRSTVTASDRDEHQYRWDRTEVEDVLPRFNEAAIEWRSEQLWIEQCEKGHERIGVAPRKKL